MRIELKPTVDVPGDRPLVRLAKDRAPERTDPMTHSAYFLIDGRRHWRPCDRVAATVMAPEEWPYPPEEGYDGDGAGPDE